MEEQAAGREGRSTGSREKGIPSNLPSPLLTDKAAKQASEPWDILPCDTEWGEGREIGT